MKAKESERGVSLLCCSLCGIVCWVVARIWLGADGQSWTRVNVDGYMQFIENWGGRSYGKEIWARLSGIMPTSIGCKVYILIC